MELDTEGPDDRPTMPGGLFYHSLVQEHAVLDRAFSPTPGSDPNQTAFNLQVLEFLPPIVSRG
jgi:hypothetical protein